MGAVDWATTDADEAVHEADLVIFCTPMMAMGLMANQIAPHLKPGCFVTDVGSVKNPVVRLLEPIFSRVGAHFVGSHPMAGSQFSGVRAARADLFIGKPCLVTPTALTPHKAQKAVAAFWKALGGKIRILSPRDHDAMIARVSHLPHMAASALVNTACHDDGKPLQYAGPGFRDTTRVASGDPAMWADIGALNRQEIGPLLDQLIEQLTFIRSNLGRQALEEYLWRAKKFRDKFDL